MKLTGIRDIDNYTYLHSVDVCIYSVFAGKSMHLPMMRLQTWAWVLFCMIWKMQNTAGHFE